MYMTENLIMGADSNVAPDSWLGRIPECGQQPESLLNLCNSTKTIDQWRLVNPT